ncbi:MAG TPA: YIP1 family protein, partial [Candidatus Methanoculleus thermohydrogenotrophicum]|nr:YIP1 family protein [Candidatus Methanoculleus thermohydrogenotrophicum]HQC91623.1 YIP1 family protein [Candidatus Methanoculleus thermohydrogenotrophicum]
PPMDIVLRPERYFQERLSGDVALWIPAAIVIATAVAQVVFINLVVSSTARLVLDKGFPDPALSTVSAFLLITGCVSWVLLATYFWIFTPRPAGTPGQGFFRKTLAVAGYGRIPAVAGYCILIILFAALWPMVGIAPVPGEKYHEYLDAEAAMRAHLDLENPSEVQRAHELLPHVIALQREAEKEAVAGYNQVLDEMKQNQVMVVFFAAAKGLLVLCALWGGVIMGSGLKRAAGVSMRTAAVLVAVPVGLEVLLIMTGLVA